MAGLLALCYGVRTQNKIGSNLSFCIFTCVVSYFAGYIASKEGYIVYFNIFLIQLLTMILAIIFYAWKSYASYTWRGPIAYIIVFQLIVVLYYVFWGQCDWLQIAIPSCFLLGITSFWLWDFDNIIEGKQHLTRWYTVKKDSQLIIAFAFYLDMFQAILWVM